MESVLAGPNLKIGVCVCVRACVRACVCACVRVRDCVRACARVRAPCCFSRKSFLCFTHSQPLRLSQGIATFQIGVCMICYTSNTVHIVHEKLLSFS